MSDRNSQKIYPPGVNSKLSEMKYCQISVIADSLWSIFRQWFCLDLFFIQELIIALSFITNYPQMIDFESFYMIANLGTYLR